MRHVVLVAAVLACRSAHADEGIARSRHLLYAELLGKGGVYGLGYEYTLMPWISVGAAASFSVVGDQQVTTAAPYVHSTLLRLRRHALFTELGAIVAHSRIPSPVGDWNGSSRTGTGGFLALGYEHDARHLVVRASGAVVAGQGGVGPMAGLSLGWRR